MTDRANVAGKPLAQVLGLAYVEHFFKTVLASLIASADAGFDVAFYVGYDAGDPVWDRDPEEKELVGLLQVRNRSLPQRILSPGRNSQRRVSPG